MQGNSLIYSKNPTYWDKEKIGGPDYKLPFVDKITYRVIKDEATLVTALRTAKLDVLEAVRWSHVDELKKSAPKIQWSRYLANGGQFVALRMDHKPFDDIRVRRALNLAVNKQEIVKSYYGGNAEMLAYPMHPTYTGYFEPLEQMPDAVKELFTYNPAKAKQLLAEAGYPNGFTFKVQTNSSSAEGDLLQMVAAYLDKVGVKMEIQTLEYGAYFSAMMTKTNAPGYFMFLGNTNPTTALRKSFVKGQVWNPMQFSDPEIDQKMAEVYAEPDERVRQVKVRLMTRQIMEKAPVILLPTALRLHRLVAVGEELRRRAARRLRAARPDPRTHVGRPGDEEEDGVLMARLRSGLGSRRRARDRRTPVVRARPDHALSHRPRQPWSRSTTSASTSRRARRWPSSASRARARASPRCRSCG